MDALKLVNKINVLFENEWRTALPFFKKRYFLGSRKYICKEETTRGEYTKEIFKGNEIGLLNDTYEKAELSFENLELLRKLYSSITGNDYLEREFINTLFGHLKEGNQLIAYLPFEVLIKIGKIDDVLLFLPNIDSDRLYYCLQDLTELIRFETKIFSSENIEKIVGLLNGLKDLSPRCNGLIEEINNQINEINHRLLKKELEEINSFEIERNKEEVKQKLKEQNFDSQLIKGIDGVSQKYSLATKNEEFAECLGLARNVLENLEKAITKRIIEKKKVVIKGRIEVARDVRAFLKEQRLITEKQWLLLGAIYGFLSDEGSHSLISTKDQARLGKNMLIEIALLLLKNNEKYEL